jgi:ribosomal protein L37E
MIPDAEPEPCARCGSRSVHASRKRSAAERLVAAFTPLHLVRCRSCGARSWSLREPPSPGAAEQRDVGLPHRPREARDERSRRRRLKRLMLVVLGAALLGAAVAMLLVR